MRALIGLFLYLLSFVTLAVDCKTAITTPDVNECERITHLKVEDHLNKVYQRVIKSLERPDTETEGYSEIKKRLVTAQRAWVKFREADCEAVYAREMAGTARTVMYLSCMKTHAETRIKELEKYDVSWP